MNSNLGWRIITAALFIPVLIIVTHHGHLPFLALVDLIIFVGMYEFYGMMEAKGIKPYKHLGILSGLLLSWQIYFKVELYQLHLSWTVLLLLIMMLNVFQQSPNSAVERISTTLFGLFYVSWLFSYLLRLRELPIELNEDYSMGIAYALLPFLITWSNDTTSYFIGIKWGHHRLIPSISPHKSIEGSFLGFLAAILAAFLARVWFLHYLSLWDCLFLGGMGGFLAQVGDLVESLLKRDANLKDSSQTIPGHGGVLDRFDSLLFTIPFVYYYLTLRQ